MGKNKSIEPVKRDERKISKKEYVKKLRKLQIELVKLQEWIKYKGLKVVAVFEGRDAAGKGGVIKCISPKPESRICRVLHWVHPPSVKNTMVLSALCGPIASGRRNGAFRPQLV